jgi:hypothetical protein
MSLRGDRGGIGLRGFSFGRGAASKQEKRQQRGGQQRRLRFDFDLEMFHWFLKLLISI